MPTTACTSSNVSVAGESRFIRSGSLSWSTIWCSMPPMQRPRLVFRAQRMQRQCACPSSTSPSASDGGMCRRSFPSTLCRAILRGLPMADGQFPLCWFELFLGNRRSLNYGGHLRKARARSMAARRQPLGAGFDPERDDGEGGRPLRALQISTAAYPTHAGIWCKCQIAGVFHRRGAETLLDLKGSDLHFPQKGLQAHQVGTTLAMSCPATPRPHTARPASPPPP